MSLGLFRMLPMDRVLVGIRADRDGAWGGFHYPNQGYRHLQMRAVITMQGPLDTGLPADPDLACLDLLRAYAHDCLHYGSYRSYRLDGDDLVRTQYGLNFRRSDGRTYSAPDHSGSPTTRNLGIVMEGACDREARLITQAAARLCGVVRDAGMARYAYRDVTGTLDDHDQAVLDAPEARAAAAPGPEAEQYLAAMGGYERGVNARYRRFLAEVGDDEAELLHDLVLGAIISGDLRRLSGWLDARRGPRAFVGLFRAAGYTGGRQSAVSR
ncbi:hypothetical protein PV350_04610 [Streptomyces sp. PA03-6a]|nr:hypothetical protein [Streptomyces sp. PA03-6a]